MSDSLKQLQAKAAAARKARAAGLSPSSGAREVDSPSAAAAAGGGGGSSSPATRADTDSASRRRRSGNSASPSPQKAPASAQQAPAEKSFLQRLAEEHRAERLERVEHLSEAFGTSSDLHGVSSADVETAKLVGSSIAEQLLMAVVKVQSDPSLADAILNFFAPEAICFLQKSVCTSTDFCRNLLTESVGSNLGFVSSSLEACGQVQDRLPPAPAASSSSPSGLAALHAGIAVDGSTYTVLSTLTGTLVAGGHSSPFRWRNRLVQHKATESWLIIASEFVCGEEHLE